MLLVGLGNPGKSYESTRHNMGFWALDAVAASYRVSWVKRFAGFVAAPAGVSLVLLKPTTYMNRSGASVAPALKSLSVCPDSTLVIHDDLDLPLGHVRIKQGGGHGGHNGLKSLDAHIGKNYWRLRLGIGRPLEGDVVSYVLGSLDLHERSVMKALCLRIACAAQEGFLQEVVRGEKDPALAFLRA